MRKILLIISICFAATISAQNLDTKIKALKDSFISMDKQKASLDSLNNQLTKDIDRQSQAIDSAIRAKDMEHMNENSANYFASMSRERDKEQKRKMWLYFAMGGGGIIILIVGLMRKGKKRQE
ncbi:MAG: hypothetical protein ABJA78_10180 [Ferruginibacter sp.]